METYFLKILLIGITALMLILRVRTVGWFLILFGGGILLVAALHLFTGLHFLAKVSERPWMLYEQALFYGANVLFIILFLAQADFGDTVDSHHVVLQYVIGKNSISEWAKQYSFLIMGSSLIPLLLVYLLMWIHSIS